MLLRGILEGSALDLVVDILSGEYALVALSLLTDCLRGGQDGSLLQLVCDAMDSNNGWEHLEILQNSKDKIIYAHANTLNRLLTREAIE